MNAASHLSRRGFVGGSLAVAGLSGLMARAQPERAGRPAGSTLKLGVASYSFSKFPLDVMVKALRRLDVHYVSVKDAHLPLDSSRAERQAVASALRNAGITPLSCGVITTNDDEAQIRRAFEYARDLGVPTIVGKPTRASLPLIDRFVKEYDIRMAIHNHGPEDKVWPSPLDVWGAVQSHDERIGLCIDVGHTARCRVDPVKAIRTCAPRLYDLHIKDIGGRNARPGAATEVGRGELDEAGILRALLDTRYAHHVGLEYEKDLNDPVPGVAESLGYLRGVLDRLSS